MSRVHRHRMRVSPQRLFQLAAAALFNGYSAGFQKGKIFTGGSKAVCVPIVKISNCMFDMVIRYTPSKYKLYIFTSNKRLSI